MYGRFGTAVFGSTEFEERLPVQRSRRVVVLGDVSTHGGTIISTNQDGTLKVNGIEVAVEDALHSCPQHGHGTTQVTAVTKKTFQNGKLILTEEAVAGCGAKIKAPDRKVYIG